MKTRFPAIYRHVSFAFLAALLATSCERSEPLKKGDSSRSRARTHRENLGTARRDRGARDGYRWNAGDFSSYTLESAFVLGPSSQKEPIDAAKSGLVVRGTYSTGVLAVEDEKVVLVAAMNGAQVLRGGERCPLLEQLINETPALITLDREGAVLSLAFPADVPAADRKILRSVYGWEFQIHPGSKTWNRAEASAKSGDRFQCRYTREDDGSVTKVRFLPPGTSRSASMRQSLFTARIGRCWIDSLQGREIIGISSEEMGELESRMSVSLNRLASTSLPEILGDIMNHPPQPGEFTLEPLATATRTPATERIRTAVLQEKHRNTNYEAPVEALSNAAVSGDHARTVAAMHELRDVLLAKPEFATRVVETLKSGVSPELSAMLAHALELANTQESQTALATILNHPKDYSPAVLAQAIVAAGGLGTLKDPSIIDSLDRIQSEFVGNQDDYPLADAALFSLSRLANHNPQLEQSLVAALTPMLAGSDEQSRCTALLALNNTGFSNPELNTLAENLLESPSPQTRAAALAYFEKLHDPSPALLEATSQLLKDSDAQVQLQAVATLTAFLASGQNTGSMAALTAIASDDSASPDVRTAAKQALDATHATAGN